ncbi:MAG: hypothetical protein COB20_13645 [SAR86 cluster bacterium]|uniref:Uncharacterized protein n=1 Tax=SAR86 cluster bacterium TaxID=2030880 RepID=A0A2A4WYG6_9GAMM|nr:MAG: hypothetical protein COB20_13645 [SAR86 cluster bacterium]
MQGKDFKRRLNRSLRGPLSTMKIRSHMPFGNRSMLSTASSPKIVFIIVDSRREGTNLSEPRSFSATVKVLKYRSVKNIWT